jgi:hypothetical protein
MKSSTSATFSAPLVRRDLIAILAYVNHGAATAKCVDGTFNGAAARLNRLAAAAGMQ